jgi:serine/threonine-protein kinase RsbW
VQPDRGTIKVSNQPRAIEDAQERLLALASKHGYQKASLFALRLAVHEAITNAFRHGHKNLPPQLPVKFAFRVGDRTIRVSIEDKGPGFAPNSVPDPTLEENLERPSGRGLLLMRAYMSKVSHNARGNRLELVYKKPPATKPAPPA